MGSSKGFRAVYRRAEFWDKWSMLPLGVSSPEVSHRATKHDFVRRVIKEFSNYKSPGFMLGRMSKEYSDKALWLIRPYIDEPDVFVAALNIYRDDCFSATNFKDSGDPVGAILEMYLGDKECLEVLASVPLDEPRNDDADLPDTAYRQGLERTADITRMMATDNTEPKTTQGVANHIEKANAHLQGRKVVRILRFLHNPSLDEDEGPEMLGDLQTLDRMTSEALTGYCNLFVSTLVESLRGKWDIDNEDRQRDRLASALKRFGFKINLITKRGWNTEETGVFVDALSRDAGDDLTAFEKLILVAQKAPGSSKFQEDASKVLLERFTEESEKQTNFNSALDFVDSRPEVREYRSRAFGTVQR